MIKYGVKIMPREVILDTQGRTVEGHFKSNGIAISNCRVGKYIEVEIDANDKAQAEASLKKMLETGLYNPLIEKYEVQSL